MTTNSTKLFLSLALPLIFNAASFAQTAAAKSAEPAQTTRAQCFAFDALPIAQRRRAEELLLKALDSEALYTIVGGIKPMSSGFRQFRVAAQTPRLETAEAERIIKEIGTKKIEDLKDAEKASLSRARAAVERRDAFAEIEDARQILAKWRCGEPDEIFADVHHFERTFDGKRALDTVVFARSSLRRMLAEKQTFFARWGITPEAHPLTVLYAIETDATSARNAGYGFLFGYPDYAVRFFVEAVTEEDLTGNFVARDFRSIPTFARETNGFVYAVPKNQVENQTDKDLRASALRILTEYKRRRAEYIGAGKKGVVELLRDWFCDRNNVCSARRATD